jgi:hypothetical protein
MFLLLMYVGWWLIAGFVPPASPLRSADETAAWFGEHPISIRLGVILTLIGSGLQIAFFGTLSVQLKRIEGRWSPCTYTQLVGAATTIVVFLIPCGLWQAAAYRPYDEPVLTQRLNDAAWLMFIGITITGVLQAVAIGIATLQDARRVPIFPRWSAYANFWVAVLFFPGTIIPFFKSGPFAWNGVIGFWVVLAGYTIWVPVLTVVLLRAVAEQERAGTLSLTPSSV